jgi:hypothetical protein
LLDVFIKTLLDDCSETEKSQIAKEFVKFNERCMIRLLGDMRSYNYVIVPIHDFDQVVYKFVLSISISNVTKVISRFIGHNSSENYPMVKLVKDKLQDSSIEQYKMKNELYWLKNSFGRNAY